jgi:tetratricopeptide (TPR) repeat protein
MHIDTASSYWNLGHVYEEIGDTEKAIDSYTNALSYFEHKLGKENTYTIACYEKIADLLFQIKSYRQSGEDYSKAIGAYYTLGTKQEEDGNYEEALDSFNKLLALYERVSGPDHVNTASAHCAIARVYDHKKEHGKAIEHYETALSIQRSDEKGNMEDISSTCNNIAQVYYHIKDFESSLKYHTESLNLKKQLYDEGDIRIAHSYNNIGFVYIAIRNLEMAIACLSKALEIYEKTLGENHEQCIGLKDYISQMKSELEHNSHE